MEMAKQGAADRPRNPPSEARSTNKKIVLSKLVMIWGLGIRIPIVACNNLGFRV